MSSDYEDAIANNSTFIRIGSSIFGRRGCIILTGNSYLNI